MDADPCRRLAEARNEAQDTGTDRDEGRDREAEDPGFKLRRGRIMASSNSFAVAADVSFTGAFARASVAAQAIARRAVVRNNERVEPARRDAPR